MRRKQRLNSSLWLEREHKRVKKQIVTPFLELGFLTENRNKVSRLQDLSTVTEERTNLSEIGFFNRSVCIEEIYIYIYGECVNVGSGAMTVRERENKLNGKKVWL